VTATGEQRPYRPTIGGTSNAAVRRGTAAKNNGRYNGNGREWATPPEVFGPLDDEFGFTLDPCATAENAKCPRYFTELDNGLAQSWAGERVFMNPPYGREVYAWTRKAAQEAGNALVVGLLPASTDLAWWHDDVLAAGAEVRYIRGRVRFLTGGPYRASGFFASVIAIWRDGMNPAHASSHG
jgi:site-specific DNA-methyltransferase (adenine-specific)